jgi:hypothetical protein
VQASVVAIVVREVANGWVWALRDQGGVLRASGHAATQDIAMADGWRTAREVSPARPFPDLIVDRSDQRKAA